MKGASQGGGHSRQDWRRDCAQAGARLGEQEVRRAADQRSLRRQNVLYAGSVGRHTAQGRQ